MKKKKERNKSAKEVKDSHRRTYGTTNDSLDLSLDRKFKKKLGATQ